MPVFRPSELHHLGIRAKKSLSQNFLIDGNILEKICHAADVQEGDTVLEIGPGPGALTERLLEKKAKVIAIEKDQTLAEKLHRFDHPDLTIYCDDALTFPLETLPSGLKVIANLPYHITTPIMERLITCFPAITSLTLMVQREVALRMVAAPNTKDYSRLTLFLNAYSTPHYCFTVKPQSFFPAPSVHSAIVHLPLHPFPFAFDQEKFFTLIRYAFRQRRKMIRSSLQELYKSAQVEEALIHLGLLPTTRPEDLSFELFATLFETLETQK